MRSDKNLTLKMQHWLINKTAVGGSGISDIGDSLTTAPSGEVLLSIKNNPLAAYDNISVEARRAQYLTPIYLTSAPMEAQVVAEGLKIPAVKHSASAMVKTN